MAAARCGGGSAPTGVAATGGNNGTDGAGNGAETAGGLSKSDSSEGSSAGSLPMEGATGAGRSWAARVAKSSGEITLACRAASSCCSSVGAGVVAESSGRLKWSVILAKIRACALLKEQAGGPLVLGYRMGWGKRRLFYERWRVGCRKCRLRVAERADLRAGMQGLGKVRTTPEKGISICLQGCLMNATTPIFAAREPLLLEIRRGDFRVAEVGIAIFIEQPYH